MSRFLAFTVLIVTLCCSSILSNAQSQVDESSSKEKATWVSVIKVTSEIMTSNITEIACYETVISEREKAIAEQNQKSTLKRWFTSANPAAKSVKPGEYLENQRFYTETVCTPMEQIQYDGGPYFATYAFDGEIRTAAFEFYPQDKILILEDGTVVDELQALR